MLINNSQCTLMANVQISVIDTITNKQRFYYGKNRVTMSMLYGIGEYLVGTLLNDPNLYLKYIPAYVLFGSGQNLHTGSDASLTNLDAPYDISKKAEISVPAHEGIRGNIDNDATQAVFHAYVGTGTYAPTDSLGEVGLFSSSGALLARTVLRDPDNPGTVLAITQGNNEIIDVQWTITVTSVAETTN